MTAAHDELKDYAAAYVLDSLDADERTAFEAHVTGCAECAAEVRTFRRVVAALAVAVPQRSPRPELRDRVLAAIGAAPGRLAEAERRRPLAAPAVREWAAWLPAAAMIVIAVGIGVYAVRLQTRVADLEARLDAALTQVARADRLVADSSRVAAELQSAMGVIAAPDLARIDLAGQPAAPGASARALWSRNRGMVFTAANLPPLPAGRVYQVWVIAGPAPISAGLLTPDTSGGGLAYYSTPADIPPPQAVAVTLEPAGGVPAPTGAMYLVGKPGAAL
jgi:anti-sigma-K factor RskA